MRGKRRVPAVLVLACIANACSGAASQPALAVGEITYTAAELASLNGVQRQELAELTAFALLVSNGALARLGEPLLARERQRLLLERLALEVSARVAGLDDRALRQAYRRAPEYELEVRHVVVLSERWRTAEQRASARELAETVLRRARAGEDFAALAAEYSDEPGAAERGGLLRPGREGTWVAEFWEAAAALDVGAISGVVETEYGFHVLKLEDRRPVPFDEVRDRVLARQVAGAGVTDSAAAWADRQAAMLDVDAAAVLRWRAGDAPDSAQLASWSGGGYRGNAFRGYLATLEDGDAERVEHAADSAYVAVVRAAARNALLAERARTMGIELPAGVVADISRRWHDRALAWAAALGFREGLAGDALKRAALAALGATDQNARIARERVLSHSRALATLYPVRLAPPDSAGLSPALQADRGR